MNSQGIIIVECPNCNKEFKSYDNSECCCPYCDMEFVACSNLTFID